MPFDDAIITPYRSSKTPVLGPLALMVATRGDLALLCRRLALPRDQFQRIFTSRLYQTELAGIPLSVAGPMMGAPYAAAILETLIAWGARRILFWGWCGAIATHLRNGDLVLPTAALSGEGTSRHYQPELAEEEVLQPSRELVKHLGQPPAEGAPHPHPGLIWTTDAVFRETREKIADLQAQGVLAVEMELAALFSVARFRGVALAGLLVVSDELGTLAWRPGFSSDAFQQGRAAGLARVLTCCQALG
ncbi:MAG: nucleoside phosphorylase [Desulfobacterales bacterium]